MSGGFFRGTSIDQDPRFGFKEAKMLKAMSFPKCFATKVHTPNLNIAVLKPVIAAQVINLLGFEDDVLLEFIFTLLEEKTPDPRKMQLNLTGFLEDKAEAFMSNLWLLLIEAQDGIGGIPARLVEEKKRELEAVRLERLARLELQRDEPERSGDRQEDQGFHGGDQGHHRADRQSDQRVQSNDYNRDDGRYRDKAHRNDPRRGTSREVSRERNRDWQRHTNDQSTRRRDSRDDHGRDRERYTDRYGERERRPAELRRRSRSPQTRRRGNSPQRRLRERSSSSSSSTSSSTGSSTSESSKSRSRSRARPGDRDRDRKRSNYRSRSRGRARSNSRARKRSSSRSRKPSDGRRRSRTPEDELRKKALDSKR